MTRVLVSFAAERVMSLAERWPEVEFVEVESAGSLGTQGAKGGSEDLAKNVKTGAAGAGSSVAPDAPSRKDAPANPDTSDSPASPLPEGEVLLSSPQGAANLSELLDRGVKWVHVVGTGVDRFPMELLNGQTLTCSRGASSVPISEWVMAHILAEARHLPEIWITEKPERWFFPTRTAATLVGMKLAIIGLGAIATETAKRAMAFGMEVTALRRTDKPALLEGIRTVTSAEELLSDADCLVVACALTDSTRALVDETFLSHAKPGLHLLNVARGEIIDETALRNALDKEDSAGGSISRASLDTVSNEPLPEGHWMFSHPKIRLTPHISWSEPGALERLLGEFEANLSRWLSGETLNGIVDQSAGY